MLSCNLKHNMTYLNNDIYNKKCISPCHNRIEKRLSVCDSEGFSNIYLTAKETHIFQYQLNTRNLIKFYL